MRQAERQMRERLQVIDVIVEVVDARAPLACRNEAFLPLIGHRGHVIALGKSDLAEDATTRAWAKHFEERDQACIYYNHSQKTVLSRLVTTLLRADKEARDRRGSTTPRLRALRAMIVGLPNVGKSTLINRSMGKKSTVTGPRPGVTRSQQWVKLSDQVELLDTPGVFMPRVADGRTGLNLGLTAALKDEHVGEELLAQYLYWTYSQRGLSPWLAAYDLPAEPTSHNDLFDSLATISGKLLKGGEPDRLEAARRILRDFRSGKFGPLSLQSPADPIAPISVPTDDPE